MIDILLTTRLKVADPTALTALATLRDRLGLADRIEALGREEIFLFEVEAPAAEARVLVDNLARRTNLFLNPNKHTFRLQGGDELAAPAADGPAGTSAWLLVWAADDGEALEVSVHRHLGLAAVASVRRGWLWKFTPTAGSTSERLLAATGQAAFGNGERPGFLVHAAWQEGRLYAERPSVYDVREAFHGAARPAGRRD